jgi:hypothetical protein
MTRHSIAAWLFVAVVVLVIVSALVPEFPNWLTGLVAWGACLLLWPRLSRNQARVTLLLLVFGIAGVLWGDFPAISKNFKLIATIMILPTSTAFARYYV